MRIGDAAIASVDPADFPAGPDRAAAIASFQDQVKAALNAVGYPASADPAGQFVVAPVS